MMLDGSRRFFAAMSLLLAIGQGCARSPSAEVFTQKQVASAVASMTATDSSRGGLANTLPVESTSASTYAATAAAGESAMKDCDAFPLADKEACYASYVEAALVKCEQARLYSCMPYARVHRAEMELKQVREALLQDVRDTYSSYEDNQPGYVKDVESAYAAADTAWHAYRDAHCTLEPVIQGMSRQEAPGLTEVCRADMTETRVKELKEQKSTLFARGAGK